MNDKSAFTRIFEYILAEGDESSTSELLPLSDLDHERLQEFISAWTAIDDTPRATLLAAMGKLTDERIELSFNRIYQYALQDPDEKIRRIAIENLWESEDPKLITLFMGMAKDDPSDSVRSSAITALGRFILLGQYSKIPPKDLSNIEDLLLSLVTKEDVPLQRACIESLGYSSRPGVEAIIQAAYLSDVEGLRQSSLLAMGRSANERWAETIEHELISKSPQLRSEAAKASGELELRSALVSLIELLDDVNDDVRINAIWSLGQIGGAVAREALEALQATDVDPQLEAHLEEALEHIAFLEGTPDFLLFDYGNQEDEFA